MEGIMMFEVRLNDCGKTYSKFYDTDQQVIIRLAAIYIAYRNCKDVWDVQVFDDGLECTDAQWVEEVVADILEMLREQNDK